MSVNNKAPFSLTTYKHILFVFVKLAIVFGAGYFIYHSIIHHKTLDLDYLINSLQEYNIISIKNIAFLLLLTILNWLIESYKWQVLVNYLTPISFIKAIEQSLGALTASIITPNRIGEYGAKAIYFSKPFRKTILGLTLIGNLSQLLATILFGIIGLGYFIYTFQPEMDNYKIAQLCIFILISIYFFFYYQPIKKLSFRGYSFQKLKTFTQQLNKKTLLSIIFLALLRYLIFTHQFYFLLTLFAIKVTYSTAFALITSMYIISSVLPTIFIFDAVIKGGVAVWLFSFIGANELIIVVITTLMWLLNFALPSIFGSYFVLNFKMNFSKPST